MTEENTNYPEVRNNADAIYKATAEWLDQDRCDRHSDLELVVAGVSFERLNHGGKWILQTGLEQRDVQRAYSGWSDILEEAYDGFCERKKDKALDFDKKRAVDPEHYSRKDAQWQKERSQRIAANERRWARERWRGRLYVLAGVAFAIFGIWRALVMFGFEINFGG